MGTDGFVEWFIECVIPPGESRRIMANIGDGTSSYGGGVIDPILYDEAVEFAEEQIKDGDKVLGEALLAALKRMEE